ncbi:hypothetical protein G6F37_008108 [Rhizopus arrhizus]|nr:hypothetical protein G6F38_008184 [Rhizopus arrhizus]KAG1155903.1 hypothetical protein G6F37_008108 [Rhizopus arrhizus]
MVDCEGGYVYQIWLPLFKLLFAINGDGIRLKTEESVHENSTNEKIDVRFTYDFEDQKLDLCGMEVCLSNEDE